VVLGNPHSADASRSSFNSQVSSVFRHPGKRDLYIAVADRWLPGLPAAAGDRFASGDHSRAVLAHVAKLADPHGNHGPQMDDDPFIEPAALAVVAAADTSIADYVWLPIRFDEDLPVIDWRDEWSPDEFEDL
jgi:hypothetical protein